MDQHIEKQIVAVAASHQLPQVVTRAMVLVESSGIASSTRFEPAFYRNYIMGMDAEKLVIPPGVTLYEEKIGRATSWGLLQIMGQTARERGFKGKFKELLTPEVGLEWGCRYLRWLADRYLDEGGWPVVCRAYNGGPGNRHNLNNTYPTRVLGHIPGSMWPA